MKKRLLSLALCAAMALSLAACGGGNETQPSTSTPAQAGSAGSAGSAGPAAAGSSAAMDPVTLKLSLSVAVNTPGDQAAQYFIEQIEQRSNGLISIDYYPGGQLGSSSEIMEQLLAGSCDIVWQTVDWFGDLQPDYNVLGLGFAVESREHLKAFLDSEKNAEIKQRMLEENGVRILTDQGLANGRVVVSKFPINSAEDMANKNMRVPDITLYVKTWQAIGVNCVTLPSGDVYMGLKEGTVDAVEFPLGSIYAQSWYEVAPYITYTNHLFAPYLMAMNEKSFQKLSPEMQDLIYEIAGETAEKFTELDQASVDTNVQKMVDAGAILNETPDLASFQSKLTNSAAECEAEGLWSAGLYDYIQGLK